MEQNTAAWKSAARLASTSFICGTLFLFLQTALNQTLWLRFGILHYRALEAFAVISQVAALISFIFVILYMVATKKMQKNAASIMEGSAWELIFTGSILLMVALIATLFSNGAILSFIFKLKFIAPLLKLSAAIAAIMGFSKLRKVTTNPNIQSAANTLLAAMIIALVGAFLGIFTRVSDVFLPLVNLLTFLVGTIGWAKIVRA